MKVLLDTCTFLWVITNPKQLSTKASEIFKAEANEVYLSPISIWEVTVKHQKDRITFPKLKMPVADFLIDQREQHSIMSLPLSEKAVSQLAKLPHHHRDPFDRMLICQAVAHGMVMLTPDVEIHQYPVAIEW